MNTFQVPQLLQVNSHDSARCYDLKIVTQVFTYIIPKKDVSAF